MTDVEFLLSRLAVAPQDRDLSALEADVAARIAGRRAELRSGGGLPVQVAVAGIALLLGIAIAQSGQFAPMRSLPASETVVLSDDSALAPSVELEGGT